jgi:hypothetical protein
VSGFIQHLYDAGIAGNITWMYDTAWGAWLGAPDARIYEAEPWPSSALEVLDRLYGFAQRSGLHVDAPLNDELRLVQRLHDAEFSGSIDWRPGFGFSIEMDGERASMPSWVEAEAWLRAKGNSVLRELNHL